MSTTFGRLLAVEEAAAHVASWQRLAQAAIEPDPFYAPAFAIPALRLLSEGRRAQVVTAWRARASGGEPRLVGLLPVARDSRYLVPLAHRCAATLTSALTVPRIDPDEPATTAAALLDALARASVLGLLLPCITEGGPAHASLHDACERDGLLSVVVAKHRRAFLRSDITGPSYARGGMAPRRRKEAERQRRRMAEIGTLAFSVAREHVDVVPALEAFLAFEARGWKGRAGTDLSHAPGGAFVRAAAANLASEDSLRVALLRLDDRSVAAGLVIVGGRGAYYYKTTYDETLARFSPGPLLALDLTAYLLADTIIDGADSLAVASHPMIDRVWHDRRAMMSLVLGTLPGATAAPRFFAAAERRREAVRLATLPLREALRVVSSR